MNVDVQFEADGCDCPCHRDDSLDHCAPCCILCPHCERGIKPEVYQAHLLRCQASAESGRAALSNRSTN